MLSLFCRRILPPGAISNLFKTKYQNFSIFSSPKSKPSLVRSSITRLNIINCKGNLSHYPTGARYKRQENIPADYILVYRERHIGLVYCVLAASYCGFLAAGYTFLRYKYGWNLNWNPLNFFDDDDETLVKARPEVALPKFLAHEYLGIGSEDQEEYLIAVIVLALSVIALKWMLHYPVRIYQNGSNNIGVCMGLLGPYTKKYIHWEHMDCRPIQPIHPLVWRKHQYQINGKYYILVKSYFRTSTDFEKACVDIPVPTLLNKIFSGGKAR